MNNLSIKHITTTGTIVLFLAIFSYIGYTQFISPPEITSNGGYLGGDFFDNLKKIKDERITFANISNNIDAVFKTLNDTRDFVTFTGGNGRANPFVK